MSDTRRLVLVFLDGVGIGREDTDSNPFFRASLPFFGGALGGIPSLSTPRVSGELGLTFPVDARLGVDGTPQSGTGQVSLLTGHNGPRRFGRHFGPWTPVALRPLLASDNVLVRCARQGRIAAFANAYPKGWPGSLPTRRQAAPPLAAKAAGLLVRHSDHLVRGEAVSSEIVNGPWRRRLGPKDLPHVSPEEAGANLAAISRQAHLTFYAHYATDYAGHRGGMKGSVRALERVDAFLGGLIDALDDAGTGVLVVSDHGNIEDTTGGHTLNPVLGIAMGPRAQELSTRIRALTDVPDAVLSYLGPRS